MKTWKTPTDSEIEKALGKLGRAPAHRYFFSRLENPEWLEPLAKRQYFSRPPGAQAGSKGAFYNDWPEGAYLSRMAPLRPDVVKRIALAVPKVTNPYVHENLLNVALGLPPQDAAEVGKMIADLAKAHWNIATVLAYSKLIQRLAEGGQIDAAFRMTYKLFEGSGSDETFAYQELWELGEALKAIIPSLRDADGSRLLEMMIRILKRALMSARLIGDADTSYDISYALLSMQSGLTGDAYLSMEDMLAKFLVSSAIESIKAHRIAAEGALRQVEKQPASLFRSLALEILAGISPEAVEIARERMLSDGLIGDPRFEFAMKELVSRRVNELSVSEQDELVAKILAGPDREEVRNSFGGSSDEPIPGEAIDRYCKEWTRDRLLWFDDKLPESARGSLESLLKELGTPEKGGLVYPGISSPVSAEYLSGLAPSALIDYLRSWSPDRPDGSISGRRGATRLGLAEQAQAAFQVRAAEFARLATEFIGGSPTYVHHLLRGLEEAALKGEPFEWGEILALIDWILDQPVVEEPPIPFPLRDDELGWSASRLASVSLVSSGLEKGSIDTRLGRSVWDVLVRIVNGEDRLSPSNDRGGDLLTASLNHLHGKAMHAIMRYVRWRWSTLKQDESKAEHFVPLHQITALLDRHLDPGFNPSLAARAVYAVNFPLLVAAANDWSRSAAHRIFPIEDGEEERWIVAWSTYITYVGAYDEVLEMLRPQYQHAIETLGSAPTEPLKDAEGNGLGAHLMTFYWRGRISTSSDDLLWQFLSRASPETRKKAFGFVGRSLRRTKEVPDLILQRLKELWEARGVPPAHESQREAYCIERSGFTQWFASSHFDLDWSIRNLREVIRIAGDYLDDVYSVIVRLANLSETRPRDAAICLQELITYTSRVRTHLFGMPEIGTILEYAVLSGNPEALAAARAVATHLVEAGDFRFRGFFE
ncbi:MAG TPA: hypothetical protein VKI44_01595 [Acetobacteraceae bacterium]|nr:hypothetical protein [Acetobacteraceae bacterium]HME73964.1 hypothetical protein [Myxococcota bacterium]